ncbi:MAG: efflux RND transporter periplasmic adaptor subunit [Candidatus Aquicultor sp.]
MPKLNRKRIAAVAGLLLVAIIAWSQISLSSRAATVKATTAEMGNIDILVSAPAKVSLPSRAELSFKSGGRIQQIDVRRGDEVIAGQILATLDMNSILPQISQAQAGLKIAQAGLDKLRSGRSHAELAVSQAQVDQAATAVNSARRSLKTVNKIVAQAKKKSKLNVDNASVGVDTATQQLNKVRSGTTSQQLAVAIAQRDQASQALAGAQANYNKVSEVNAKSLAEAERAYDNAVSVFAAYQNTNPGDTTSTTYFQYSNAVESADKAQQRVSATNDQALQAAQTQVDSAQKAYDTANAQYNLTTASARNEDITIAQNQLKQAQISLEIAKIGQDDGSLDSQLDGAQGQLDTALKSLNVAVAQLELQKQGSRAADLKQAQAQIEQAQAQIEQAQSVAEDAVLKAPFSGRVAAVNGKAGEIAGMSAAASAGASGGGSSALITIINFDRIELTADIDEADIGKVKVGQDANVNLDAYEGKTFKGKVTDISLLSAKNSTGGTIFQVTIVVNPGKTEFREGMSGDVDITTASKKNVLTVPFDAVKVDGKKTVFIIRNGIAQQQEVKIGLSSDTSYEITSGLKEGDRIVVGKSTITNGQHVKIEP